MNKLSKIGFICALSLCIIGTSGCNNNNNNNSQNEPHQSETSSSPVYIKNITLDKTVTESTSFSEITYQYNQHASFIFSSVKAGGGVGTIDANSTITRTTPSNSITSVKVTFSGGKLILKTWYIEDEITKNYIVLTSGKEVVIGGNFFALEASDKEVVIDSISFNYGSGEAAPRPNASSATLTIDPQGGAYMAVETSENVYYALTGTYKGYIPEDIQIYHGSLILPPEEILLTVNNRFTIRFNITKHFLNTSGLSFQPHLRYNGKDYGEVYSTYQSGTGVIPANGYYDLPNARYCAWHANVGEKTIPSFSLQSRPTFELNSSVAKTEFRLHKYREADSGDNWFFPYIIRLVQTNQYYNFDVTKDYESILFWDFVEPDVRTILPYKAVLVEEIEQDGKKYQVVDFYMNMIPIFRDKIAGKETFHGTQKDTFLFHFTINHVKEGNKIITDSPYDYADNRVVLDTTIGKTGDWGGWPHGEAEDVKDLFYVKGKGQYKAGCCIMEEMPGFGMYEKLGN